ncbi:cell wall hydrolase [Oryzifoliimicrobium ureilyticus]|uniref:cell wall hydrolase n=1 Tax=Oryzifoliimicrobium ureilyticus TaxID=3113724 RepID=UPI00307657D1
MRRNRQISGWLRGRSSPFYAPILFGLAGWLGSASDAAHADLAALLAGLDGNGNSSWRMVMTTSPAGSIHQAELEFAQDTAPVDSGLVLPDGRRVAFTTGEKKHEDTADEERVNRSGKKKRILSVEPVQPPKDFSAGSIIDRNKLLFRPALELKDKSAFVKPAIKGKELQIATVFYRKQPLKPVDPEPRVIAELVNNDRPDSLAAAYASPAPDYARQSPFDSILTDKANEGRFVPQIGPKDHAWAATVLPASVFSPDEQQCLASGVYFEARGESVKGQAAVAQVILNRVRNPSYPKTICGVVYQNDQWRNRCQFSFACDDIKDQVNSATHWKIARQVAMAVTAGKIWLPQVGSATHYHAVYVRPKWAKSMEKVGRIGLHIFYRTHGGGWI